MPEHTEKPTIAIFNASDERCCRFCCLSEGASACQGTWTRSKPEHWTSSRFLEAHRPDGIIWDIASPYDRNWHFFKLIRNLRALDGCAIVLTTTHLKHLNSLVGEDTSALELVGKPYDLEAIANALMRAVEQRGQTKPRALRHAP